MALPVELITFFMQMFKLTNIRMKEIFKALSFKKKIHQSVLLMVLHWLQAVSYLFQDSLGGNY